MATNNSTATTPEELAEQFPITTRPFAVWYNSDPGADHRKWAVNDESGDAIKEFADMATALKTAAEMGREWEADAKIQAQALAKVIGADDAELSDIQARLDRMMSGKDDGAKNRIVRTVAMRMAEFLPDIDVTERLLAEQFPMTSDPYAVWFNDEMKEGARWAVNDEDGNAIVSVSNREAACTIAYALRVSASANRYNPEDVGHDIWMVHAQAIATLATVDRMEEIEGVDASEEFPAVRAMLRDMKAKLEVLASNVDVLKQPEVQHA
ncbi:MAG: hypothetical protein A3K04_09645 [Gallionellales bacterium RBG_16_56_9]|nr:MAG: hypothetical protein A3K04_09645 [Gallionellales bacterium RBG_16_56_9]